MTLWLTIIAGGAITYLTRASFILAGDRIQLPAAFERALRYVAPAAFAAIAIPAIFGGNGLSNLGDDVPRIVAALAAGWVVVATRSVPKSLVVGLVTLWILLLVS